MSDLKLRILNGGCNVAFQDVTVPEWGDAIVRVQEMTGAEKESYEEWAAAHTVGSGEDATLSGNETRARLLSFCLRDPQTSARIAVSDTEVASLNLAGCRALSRLFLVAQHLNGLGNEDTEALYRRFFDATLITNGGGLDSPVKSADAPSGS
jgi:hypothetical protein